MNSRMRAALFGLIKCSEVSRALSRSFAGSPKFSILENSLGLGGEATEATGFEE